MEPSCPACGESERLVGARSGDDIEVTCRACGHRWMRGRPRCRGCGGGEAVHKLQLMTRHPRGNQLAVVGHREVPLCPRCDAEALGGVGDSRRLPEGYVSTFLFGRDERPPTPGPAAPQRPATAARTEAPSPPLRPRRTPQQTSSSEQPARRRPPQPPTVRQAIDAVMNAGPAVDPLTMLLLGRHLGAATRLRELDEPATAAALQQWFRASWGDEHTERRAAAAATVIAAVDHWRAQGWLQQDPVDFLR